MTNPPPPERSTTPSGELSRELTLFHITMMGLGMMIGAGVFLGIGNAILYAGPGGVILTFALNGLTAKAGSQPLPSRHPSRRIDPHSTSKTSSTSRPAG